ncbi:MAG: FAD-dependent oxidoreductase [Pirellulales bacterium]|nr:FAD-dependent oxidoreductase [Pirellulales bacterium]
MRIAIVGSGISGLTAGYLLHRHHQITLLEALPTLGGHTHTVQVEHAGNRWNMDTGFMVYNTRTYPLFSRLLNVLGVKTQPSDMSFGVSCERTGWEYCGSDFNSLFAQRVNLLRPRFWGMLAEILRFNRLAPRLLNEPVEPTLGQYLQAERFGTAFTELYLLPMAAAIWSADPRDILNLPARFFVRFFVNHGLLQLQDRPVWRVIIGGARNYVEALTAPWVSSIRLNSPVRRVERHASGVLVTSTGNQAEHFDQVIFATHSDQTLRILADATPAEREILSCLPYQSNRAILHTDTRLLPRSRRAWASWNYRVSRSSGQPAAVTYWLNRLQSLDAPVEFLCSLNPERDIDPRRVIRELTFEHPIFTAAGISAQARHGEISGHNRTHYCGAYWRNGFHEDGVWSAMRVARGLGVDGEAEFNLAEGPSNVTSREKAQVTTDASMKGKNPLPVYSFAGY